MADLLSALHARLTSKFGGDAAKALNAAGTGEAATRELRLLSALAPYLSSATQAQQLLELFLPYLRLKPTPRAERVKEQVLRLVGGLLPLLERPELHLRFFGQMFAQLRARGGRAALCDLWTRLAALPATAAAADLGEIGAVAAALNELNAFDGASVDELDYERRVSGYAALPPLVDRAPPPLLLPLLANAIHDVERDDIALRHSATHTITLLARRAAAEPPPADGTPAAGVRGLLERVLMPALRRHLRLPPERNTLFVEALKLLGSTLLLLPALQPDLATLLSPAEPEADFFYNITHVQMPRRQRALARLRARVDGGAFEIPTLSHYLLPLLRALVVRENPNEADVAEEAVVTLRAVAARLPWRPYLGILQAFSRLLTTRPRLEKRLVRGIVAVIDVFHFEMDAPADDGADEVAADEEAAAEEEEEGEEAGEEAAVDEAEAAAPPQQRRWRRRAWRGARQSSTQFRRCCCLGSTPT